MKHLSDRLRTASIGPPCQPMAQSVRTPPPNLSPRSSRKSRPCPRPTWGWLRTRQDPQDGPVQAGVDVRWNAKRRFLERVRMAALGRIWPHLVRFFFLNRGGTRAGCNPGRVVGRHRRTTLWPVALGSTESGRPRGNGRAASCRLPFAVQKPRVEICASSAAGYRSEGAERRGAQRGGRQNRPPRMVCVSAWCRGVGVGRGVAFQGRSSLRDVAAYPLGPNRPGRLPRSGAMTMATARP